MRRASVPAGSKTKSTLSKAVQSGDLEAQATCSSSSDRSQNLDTVSYGRNIKELVDELEKPHPRAVIVKQLLKLTFAVRRMKINSSSSSTSYIFLIGGRAAVPNCCLLCIFCEISQIVSCSVNSLVYTGNSS